MPTVTMPQWDPRVVCTQDATREARYERLETTWRTLGRARAPWKGWDHFLAMHSLYHYIEMAHFRPAMQWLLDPTLHWEMACFYEAVLPLLQYRHTGQVPADQQAAMKRFVFCPRGTMKSTFLRRAIEWYLLHDPMLRVLYGCAIREDAEDDLLEIKGTFEHNPFVLQYFPEYAVLTQDPETGKPKRKPPMWSKKALLLPVATGADRVGPEATISAGGVDKSATGKHYDLFCPNDYVNERNAYSDTRQQQVIRVFREAFNVMPHWTVWMGDGTPWTMRDAYHWLQEDSGEPITVFTRRASSEGNCKGVPLYPAKYPLPELERLKKNQTARLYACLYDCEPTASESKTFNLSYLRYYQLKTLEDSRQPLSFHCIVDPAGDSKSTSDNTAIVLLALDHRRPVNIYVIACYRGRFEKSRILKYLGDVYEFWHGHPLAGSFACWMQKVTLDGVYRDLIHTLLVPKYPGFHIGTLDRSSRIPKFEEIGAIEPLLTNGQIFLRLQDDVTLMDLDLSDLEEARKALRPDMQALWEELDNHLYEPGHQKDDAVDALAQVKKLLDRGAVPRMVETRRPDSPGDREMVRRQMRHQAAAEFEQHRHDGSLDATDLLEQIAEYQRDYPEPMEEWMRDEEATASDGY